MRTKTRMRRTRTGVSRRGWVQCLLGVALGWEALAEDSYALVAGTVFRDPGFALPRAEVELAVVSAAARPGKKSKGQKTQSDARGEFSFRVPSGAAKYRLTVKAQGFESQEKLVEVSGDERVDVYFTLLPSK